MAVEYRAIQPEEWPQAMELWTQVFEVGGSLFQSLHEGTEDRNWDHTSVAVDESGKIVSAVDLFMRPVGGPDGKPITLAGVGSVATDESARKQGHSGKLLERALGVMVAHGCSFSMLATGVNGHYARYGWFDTPLKLRAGNLRGQVGQAPDLLTLDDRGIDSNLAVLAELFAEDNRGRPLTHVRSDHYWRVATRPRMGCQNVPGFGPVNENRRVSIVGELGSPTGYAVWEREEQVVSVLEACGDVSAVLRNLSKKLQAEGVNRVRFELPVDEPWNSAIAEVTTDVEWSDTTWWMSRNLPGGYSVDDVQSLIHAPGAHHWALDAF